MRSLPTVIVAVGIFVALFATVQLRSVAILADEPLLVTDIFDLAIDTDTAENTPSSIGSIDPCRSVATDDTFDVDFVVQDVPEPGAAALEGYVAYDPAVVEIVDLEGIFLGVDGNVVTFSDDLPDTDGEFLLAILTFADDYEAGSGVVVRMTVRAVGPGATVLETSWLDYSPGLKLYGYDTEGSQVALFTNMGYRDAEIAVDQPCSGLTDTDDDTFGDIIEDYAGTLAISDCPATTAQNDEVFDAWPVDMNDDGKVSIADALPYSTDFGAELGPGDSTRHDLNMDGKVSISDVLKINYPVFGSSCTP